MSLKCNLVVDFILSEATTDIIVISLVCDNNDIANSKCIIFQEKLLKFHFHRDIGSKKEENV